MHSSTGDRFVASSILGIALPSEQCDAIEDGTDEKSESVSARLRSVSFAHRCVARLVMVTSVVFPPVLTMKA